MKKFLFLLLLPLAAYGQGTLRRIETTADLSSINPKAIAVNGKVSVAVSGKNSPGDFGGDIVYRWDPGSAATVDNGCVYAATGGGRWITSSCEGDHINPKWFGVVGDEITDDAPAIQAAINSIGSTTFGGGKKKKLSFPNGKYLINSTIVITNPVAIVGEAVENNSVNTTDYPLVGVTFVSGITNKTPVFKTVATDAGAGDTYTQGIEFGNISIEGSGTDNAGIEFTGNSNFTDVHLYRIRIRGVGGSGIKVGDGTLTGSPRFGYLTWQDISVIRPGKDGFEIYNESFYDVSVIFERLYVNSAGRHNFNFVNIGGFKGDTLVGNNAGQSQTGHGFRFVNVHGSTFINCIAEGDGRGESAGFSYAPIQSGLAMDASGLQHCLFYNCIFTSPSGYLTGSQTNAAVVKLSTSVATNGFGARESVHNSFELCRFAPYTPIMSAPSGTVGGGGSLGDGVYLYRVTATYSGGWETPMASSAELAVLATNTSSVSLSSIPTASSPLGAQTATARKIYRTAANGSTFYLLTTISNNVATTYNDTTADGSLGAVANHFWSILLDDVNASLNRFVGNRYDVAPLIKDVGRFNFFDGEYNATVDPTLQPYVGMGTKNGVNGTYNQGSRHWYGADAFGGRAGYGLTANVQKNARWVVPSAGSYYHQSPVAAMSLDTYASSNVVRIGSGGYGDYAATHVELRSADSSSATTTNTIRHVTISSTGPLFNSPPAVENNEAYQLLDSGGTRRNGLALDSGDTMQLGYNGGRINIASGNGGIYLGGIGYSSPIYVVRSGFATSGDTLKNSQILGFVGSYWNGASESQVSGDMRLSVESTSPLYYFKWKLGSTDWMSLSSAGTLTVSNLVDTGSITLGGVSRSTWPSGAGTNASTVFVNHSTQVDSPSFNDSAEISASVSTTNITFAVVANSLATNKITTTFYDWVNRPKGFYVGAGIATKLDTSGEINVAISGTSNAILGYVDRSVEMLKLGTNFTASGDILYRASGQWTNLAKAADGTVLKLSGGLPAWGTDNTGGGGSMLENGANAFTNVNNSSDIRIAATANTATLTLSNTTVTAGTYGPGLLTLTTDAKGRLTAAGSTNNATALTNLNASELRSGTVDNARLDTDLARIGVISSASGDVLYRDATGWTNLAKAADGTVLKLSGGFPAWGTDNTGGGTTYNYTNGVVLTGTNVTANLLGAGGVTLSTNGSGVVTITGNTVTNNPVSGLWQTLGSVDFVLVQYGTTNAAFTYTNYSGVISNISNIGTLGTGSRLQIRLDFNQNIGTNYFIAADFDGANDLDSGFGTIVYAQTLGRTNTFVELSFVDNGGIAYADYGYKVRLRVVKTDATAGGGLADGDKGDITVSNNGATWTIDNPGSSANMFDQRHLWEEYHFNFAGNTTTLALETMAFTAVASGTIGVVSAVYGRNGVLGISTAASSTALNTGGVISMNNATFLHTNVTQWELVVNVTKTNGALARGGFFDTVSTGIGTDSFGLLVTNNTLIGTTVNNSSQANTLTTYTIDENKWTKWRIRATNNVVWFSVLTNNTVAWTDAITNGLPVGAGRQTQPTFGCWNSATANTNGVQMFQFDWLGFRYSASPED